MLLYLIELVIFVLLMYGVVTQILIPGVTNRAFFPLFRRRKLEGAIAEINELRDVVEINKEVKGDITQLKKKMNGFLQVEKSK